MKIGKFIDSYTKYMVVWVVLISFFAYMKPAPFVYLKSYMSLFFALTMFGIGAVLDLDSFKNIAKNPVIVLIGVCAQFTIMPFTSYLLCKVFGLPPAIAVGLILTGSAPGAMASNVISYVAKADVAYSVSLTSVSTLLTPILTPMLTFFLAKSIIDISFFDMFFSLVKMVIVPLILGICVRYFLKEKIKKIEKIFPAISVTFIVFICALVIALNKERIVEITGLILGAVILLNVIGMLLGYLTGKIFNFDLRRRRTMSIEIGMQNAGLGTVLALKHFNPETAVPAAAFVFICIFTASIMAKIWRGRTVISDQ